MDILAAIILLARDLEINNCAASITRYSIILSTVYAFLVSGAYSISTNSGHISVWSIVIFIESIDFMCTIVILYLH